MPVVIKGAWGKVALMPLKPPNRPDTPLTRAINAYLAATGEKARALSLRIGPNDTLIRKILEGASKNPRADTMAKLTAIIGPVDITADVDGPMPPPNAKMPVEVDLPARTSMPRDLPVYGPSAGSAKDGAFSINFGDVVDRVRRPPALLNNPRAYGFYVEGDSMEPLYRHGELLVADPSKPCRIGDRVNISVKSREHDGAEERMSYVKELVRRQPDKVTVKQFNPPMDLTFAADRIISMHRILNFAEAMGI